ncbi:hypothetical protein DID80_04020 [Candidatus Marinamargulisbacteria bacterium SCGC AAA071-K20]|nr:hypothetical protein DID80_04020 [Candidatus Marinamargulisbacteria bacterium SCGC AAA071-K20]
MGEELFIEDGTVKNHLKSIFKKTGVKTSLELIILLSR